MSDYINTAEIAKDLDLKQTYVVDRLVKRPDFPAPAFRLSQKTRAWDRVEFERWKEQQKRKAR